MLTTNKIHELAIKKQTTELNIKREYVQHIFLSYFYQQPQTNNIFFKGGTALRLVYSSPRFSEDLDFSTSGTNIASIENAIQNTLTEIEREGIETDISESKRTTGGYLAIVSFQLAQSKIDIQIEISSRDMNAKGEIITIFGDFIVPYTIMVLSENQLVKQKISALMSRQKPRDYYDLYFILRKEKILLPQEKNILPKVLKLLHQSKTSFNKELEQFLPRSQWAILKDFKSVLEREITKYI